MGLYIQRKPSYLSKGGLVFLFKYKKNSLEGVSLSNISKIYSHNIQQSDEKN